MIFNGGFPAAGDDDDVLDSRLQRFFDAILNDRLVYDGQHLLRLRLRCGQKSGAEPRGRENSFSNFGWHLSPVWCGAGAVGNSRIVFRRWLCYVYVFGKTTSMAYVIAE